MQLLVSRIFSNEMHLPSSVKLWQIPAETVLPSPLPLFALLLPLDEHETSYLAAAPKMLSLSKR